MAKPKKRKIPEGGFHYPWHLKEWLEALEVTQAELERRAEVSKATLSDLINGKQQYNQSHIDRFAWELKIRPFELLLHPREAAALRSAVKGNADLDTLRSSVPNEPVAIKLWRVK